jgi:AAHS family 4-hydroxybenzoate transporter-like MFS transporter
MLAEQKTKETRLTPPDSLNLSDAIDARPVHRFQLLVFALCFLCLLADGFDAQALGYVVPAMSRQWNIAPSTFAPAFSAGLIGMAFGALGLGSIADYVGRRKIIVICTAIVGAATLAMSSVSSLSELMVLRVVAGIALGGIIPNALALCAEYSPSRLRALVVMITACGISVGSALGGLVAGVLLKSHGWPIVFQIGGGLSLALSAITLLALPESIRFRAVRESKGAELATLMRRVCPGLQCNEHTRWVANEEKAPGLTVRHLFAQGRAVPTLLIWAIYFTCLLQIYFFASWLPTVLTRAGVSMQSSVYATSALQIAGTVASIALGTVLERYNPARVLTLLFLFGAASIGAIGLSLDNPYLLIVATAGAGVGVVGGQAGTHAIASRVYPTFMRSTGMGWGLGIGRIGSVVGPLVGGMLLAMSWPAQDLLFLGALPALVSAAAAFALSRLFSRDNPHFTHHDQQEPDAACGQLPVAKRT